MIKRIFASKRGTEKIAPALLTLLKGMRARYVIALLSVALLSSVSYVGFNDIIDTEMRSAAVINVSGRQRMLSQRIPMLAQMIVAVVDRNRRMPLIKQFDHSVALMKNSHAGLVHGDVSMGLAPLSSQAVRLLLFGEGTLLDNKLSLFFQRAQMFSAQAKLPLGSGSLYDPTLELAIMGGELLPVLDRIVGTFERESRDAVYRLQIWQLSIFVATLVVLVLQGLVIFWPLDRELNHNFHLLLKSRQRARKAKDEASRANRAKSEFLANMSHELRTPLNAINGFSEMMSVEAFGPIGSDTYREYAGDILKSGRHLLHIIDDIFDVAQIESESVRLSEDIVDLRAVLDEAKALFLGTATQDNITIEVMNFEVPRIVADGMRVQQIIVNLLSNAVRFSNQGGQVRMGCELNEDGGISIWVSDQGIGIDPANQAEVMDSFGQVADAYTRGHGGSGLGLSICSSLMKLHGGSLEIDSVLGEGTQVSAHFPATRIVSDA